MQKAYHNHLIGKCAYPYNNYHGVAIVSMRFYMIASHLHEERLMVY